MNEPNGDSPNYTEAELQEMADWWVHLDDSGPEVRIDINLKPDAAKRLGGEVRDWIRHLDADDESEIQSLVLMVVKVLMDHAETSEAV